MAVAEQTPYIEYTANGATTSFALGFVCESKSHLIVTVDDVEPLLTDWSLTDGNVVFTVAPLSGKLIKIQRNTPFSRTIDYQSYNNSFRAPAVNKDFNSVWYKLQELGVTDWILNNRIDALRAYVDAQDDALRATLMAEIQAQGVSLDQLDAYYNYLMQRLAEIAVNRGWEASFVVDASGKTQQEINDSIAVKFLKANEIGLVKWVNFKKPPYTSQEYEQAYSNGVNLAAAIKRANDEGFDKVILDRGNYPVCYTVTAGSVSNTINATAKLHDIYGMEVDFNESTLFVIFDSNVKNPYDLSTLESWNIGGAIFETKNVRNITFRNGTLRGDQYNRSWLNGEQQTEQTYGIVCKNNSRNVKFKAMTFTGFRGDGVSGEPWGDVLSNLDTWYKGGIDKSSGAEADITGAYRSLKIDLSGKSIIDNQVQLNTTGYLRRTQMRTDYFDVFFFDANNNLISYERGLQAEDITLPITCRYIQFVAYEDERTTATVDYGLYIRLYTGSSADFLFDENCHFYENHRGGISNLGSRTTVKKTKFHDIGGSKLGFKKYSAPTNYAVNFEDTYCTTLLLDDVDIKNVPQALLAACFTFNLVNSKIENTSLTGAAAFAVSDMTISNNKFYNVAGALAIQSNSAAFATKTYKAQGNIFRDCAAYYDISSYPKWITDISGNTFIGGTISFLDNGFGTFSNNTIFEPHKNYVDSFVLKNMGSAVGNTVHFRKHIAQYSNWARYSIDAKNSKGNKFIFLQKLDSRTLEFSENKTYKLNGTAIENGVINLMLTRTSKGWATHIDSAVISDYELINSEFNLHGSVGGAFYNSDIVFDGLNVSGNSSIVLSKNENDPNKPSTNKITIKNSRFDLTSATYLFRSYYALKGSCTIDFINCEFVSDVVKSLAFIQGKTANITATATNCRFINVVNIDNILQISGIVKTTYDPPSLASAKQQSTTITLSGAVVGDTVSVSFSQPLQGTRIWAEVTADDTVTVYHRNDTSAAVDVSSGTLTVKLI